MKIIIVGAYAIGTHLAKLLSRNDHDTVLIDSDPERLSGISSDYDLMTVQASPSRIQTLRDAGVDDADLFIAVTPDENLNMNACMLAKALGAQRTVAKVDNNEYMDPKLKSFFEGVGVTSLIYPENLAAIDIVNGLKMSWVRQRWDVHDGALIMLGIIKRENETIIPRGDDVLMLHDIAYFMTTRQYIPYIRGIVGKERYADVKNVMIMGGGATAVRACALIPEYMSVKIFESNEARCDRLNELLPNKRVMVIHGDGRDIGLLNEEGIKNTQAFVALTGNAETNILACLTAKRLGVRKTVAMVENFDYISMAESLDIGTIINKKVLAASYIYQMMLDADVHNIHFLMSANADVAEFTAEPDSKVTHKKVFELGLPKGTTIGGLVRNGEGHLVSGGTQIEAGDSVVVFCHEVDMSRIEKFFR